MKPHFITAVLAVTTTLAPARTASAQSQPIPSCAAFGGAGQPGGQAPSYQVPSYVDEPIEQLKKMVPELNGIKAEATRNTREGTSGMRAEDKTASILQRTGAVVADLLHKIPNLIAREEVKEPTETVMENHMPLQRPDQVWLGSLQLKEPITHFRTRYYTYRIVHKQTPTGGDALDELRTDAHDQPIDNSAQNPQMPFSIGFATTWLFFLPGNLQVSRFRYIAEQKIDNRETYVLAFAQNSDSAGLHSVIVSSYGRCSTPMQGVAWIDQSTFQIVRMQTDLLNPLPGIQLDQLRSIVDYGAVKIRTLGLTLWLPAEVETVCQTPYHAEVETHLYSHYRLFHSTSRILPTGESPPP